MFETGKHVGRDPYLRQGDAVALLAGQRTCDSLVAGSGPGWAPLHFGFGKLCASVTKQYNLAKGANSLAGKVTASLGWKVTAAYHRVYD